MKTGILFSAVVIFLSLNACKHRKESVQSDVPKVPCSIIVETFAEYQNSASTTINSVSIEKNIMSISVSYSGGCEKHEFELVGSKLIQKSLPPKRGIMLYHKNNGDSCRELVEEILKFDITNLAYENREIILLLEGYETPISYTPVQ